MATITATWTENQSLISRTAAGCNALGSGASETGNIDLDNSGYDLVAITVEVAFGASPDGGLDVELLASVNSGNDVDTIPINKIAVGETNNTTRRITLVVEAVPYVQVKVTNNDSADNVDVVATYAGRTWDST